MEASLISVKLSNDKYILSPDEKSFGSIYIYATASLLNTQGKQPIGLVESAPWKFILQHYSKNWNMYSKLSPLPMLVQILLVIFWWQSINM